MSATEPGTTQGISEANMTGIVCAVRGGPGSQRTIDGAVALAQETGLSLHFLYVVNLDFLTHTITSRVHTISEQMSQMGESILLAAQAKAAVQGVMGQIVVRHGEVGEEIATLCHELSADYLVLGRPGGSDEENVFTQDRLAEFRDRIYRETGASVILSEGSSG
jgi:nucleotide-binding universal stress UspA family protein